MTACLGPHMPFSLVPALHINSPSRIDMLPRSLTCGDYPTPRNPFYDVKSDPVSGLPKIPDKPIYSDSWEDRMKERHRVGKFLREASGDALERTGLAALGYTHNGLGPVPPLTVDTDAIIGKGKTPPEYKQPFGIPDYKAMDARVRQARGIGVLPKFETIQTPTPEIPIEVLRRHNPILGGKEELTRFFPLGIQEHLGPTGILLREMKTGKHFLRAYPVGGGIEKYRSPDGSIDVQRLIREGSVDLSKL